MNEEMNEEDEYEEQLGTTTYHGRQRLTKRQNLSRRASIRMAAIALARGKRYHEIEDTKLKAYLLRVESKSKTKVKAIVHGTHVYIFGDDVIGRNELVTTWPVPKVHMRKKRFREYEFLIEEVIEEAAHAQA